MPETGGPTNQSGVLYQNTPTALFLGRMLRGALAPQAPPDHEWVIQVRSEAPHHVDDTVVRYADGHHEYLQAKEDIQRGHETWVKLWQHFEAQYWASDFDRDRDRLSLYVGEFRQEHRNLREICDRARGHPDSASQWIEHLSREQQAILDHLKALLKPEHSDQADIHAFFRCIDVVIKPREDLEALADVEMPQCSIQARVLFRLIRDRVGRKAAYRTPMNAPTLRQFLEQEDGIRFDTAPDVATVIERLAGFSAILRQYPHTLGSSGIHVDRPEVNEILAWLQELPSDQQGMPGPLAVLLDTAGMGKSVVLRDVLHTLEQQEGIAVLGIKADLQLSAVHTDAELHEAMKLPDTPERCIRRVATFRPVIVLIDQVDALSLSLARDQRTLDYLLGLVARLREIPNVRLILTCRRFDLHTDPKLRHLNPDREFSLSPLPEEVVYTAVEKYGGNPTGLSGTARRLLRTPLHLNLYVRAQEMGEVRPAQRDTLRSLQDLYRLLWERTVSAPLPDGNPSVADRETAIAGLVRWMHERQTTTAPDIALTTLTGNRTAHIEAAVRYLASTGLLLRGAGGWSFLHQTFFDFCYAREFIGRGASLAEAMLPGDQGLPVRTQMLQVLAYLRGESNDAAYLRDLNVLLVSDQLRPHLRDLLFGWFGALEASTEAEWKIARRLLATPESRRRTVAAFRGNADWFRYISGDYMQSLLANDDTFIDEELVPYLGSLANTAQAEVAAVLRPWLGRGDQWLYRIRQVLGQVREWQSSEALAVYEDLFSALPPFDSWLLSHLSHVAEADTRLAGRVARRVLDAEIHAIEEAIREAEAFSQSGTERNIEDLVRRLHERSDPLDRLVHAGTLTDALDRISQNAPSVLLEAMLPWLEAVVQLAPPPEPDWPYFATDPLIDRYHSADGFPHHFLEAFRQALIAAAKQSEADFSSAVDRLAVLPYVACQELVAQSLCSVPERYAEDAARFLLEDARRLELGADEQYDSRQLITAIYPHLTEEQRSKLEASLLAYTGIKRFRGVAGLEWRGIEQLNLLRAVPGEFLSEQGQQRLRELERKLKDYQASETPPRRYATMAELVPSPILSNAARRMSDAAWLNAMKKYTTRRTRREAGRRRGGPRDLAPVLASQVREEPERFYHLALERVPEDVEVDYKAAFLSALAETPAAPAEWLFDVVRRFAPLANAVSQDPWGPELIRAIARSLERRAADGVPDDLIALLESYVRELAFGEDERSWEQRVPKRSGPQRVRRIGGEEQEIPLRAGDGLNSGPYHDFLNSVRGTVFRSLMVALRERRTGNDTAGSEREWQWIGEVAQDPSTALRAGGVAELLDLSDLDPERAGALFEQLMLGQEEELITTAYVRHFLYAGIHRIYVRVQPYIRMMLDSKYEDIQEQGGVFACISAIVHNDDALREQLETGPDTWRRGVAIVYAENIHSSHRSVCLEGLTRLVHDTDVQVLNQIGRVFRDLVDSDLIETRPFLERYFSSPAPWAGMAGRWAEYLQDSGAVLDPEWTLMMLERVLNGRPGAVAMFGNDPRYRSAYIGDTLIRTVLRIHADPTCSSTQRNRAMTLFDILTIEYPTEVYNALSEWDER
jgi:hypothetical protein